MIFDLPVDRNKEYENGWERWIAKPQRFLNYAQRLVEFPLAFINKEGDVVWYDHRAADEISNGETV